MCPDARSRLADHADCYVTNGINSGVNFNDTELRLGRQLGTIRRIGIGMDISPLFPLFTVFDAGKLRLQRWLEAGTGDNIEVQKIPPPILLDAQATWNDRTSLLEWLLAGIDVVTPPAMVTFPFINDPVQDIDGFHPFLQDAFDNEGGVLGLRLKIDDEGSGNRWARYRSSAYATEEDRPTWIIDYHLPIFVGYRICLSPGVAPNPGADQPVATVDSLAVSGVLDMAALGLVPNVQYFGAVSPFNTVGWAATRASWNLPKISAELLLKRFSRDLV